MIREGGSCELSPRKRLKTGGCNKITVINRNYEVNVTDLANTPRYLQLLNLRLNEPINIDHSCPKTDGLPNPSK
jgi:hypothetical protein